MSPLTRVKMPGVLAVITGKDLEKAASAIPAAARPILGRLVLNALDAHGWTALALCAVIVFYKEYAITSFDAGFARSLGMPVQIFHYSLMLLLAFAIVSSLQAVGVLPHILARKSR